MLKHMESDLGARAAKAADPVCGIAVVGLAGRYPEADCIDRFWQNLAAGRDCIREIPRDRWDYRRRAELGKPELRWGGFIDGVDAFDSLFFNISPREAVLMDPQERLFLEVAWEALEDAGYLPETLVAEGEARDIGVFVGAVWTHYQTVGAEEALKGRVVGPNSYLWAVANRVSYTLNLTGPSLAIDTACSSSLTALHMACEAIRQGECRAAIAGGVNLDLHPSKRVITAGGGFLSPDGRCFTFSNRANGYVAGEGVGAVLLKPLADAERDGDPIRGMILSSAVNHGGKASGFTVPRTGAQEALISQAFSEAGLDARTVSYVEAHGTGTKLGDPIEIQALSAAFRHQTGSYQNGGPSYCSIGSVKSNIGHLEAAAGIAGLTKVLLQFRHRQLAPSIHTEELNEHIDFERTPFVVQRRAEPWKRPLVDGVEMPRRAGLSSFGAGGANAHLILEEYRGAERRPDAAPHRDAVSGRGTVSLRGTEVFVLSARSAERLKAYAKRFADALDAGWLEALELRDITYTLQLGRKVWRHRLAVVARSHEQLRAGLRSFLAGRSDGDVMSGDVKSASSFQELLDAEDREEVVRILTRRGKPHKLARLWCDGVLPDWHQVRDPRSGRRVSLPTYPFAREKHWIGTEDPVSVEPTLPALHPLIDVNVTTFGRQAYQKVFDAEHFLLRDHVVDGEPMLPGVGLLEMARAAGELACGSPVRRLESVSLAKPITSAECGEEISVELEPTDDPLRFTICSAGAGDERDVYARGDLWLTAPATHAEDPLSLGELSLDELSLEGLRARLPQRRDPAWCYEFLGEGGIVHGSTYQVLQELWHSEEEALSRLVAPSDLPVDSRDLVLHPSMMEGLVQTTLGLWQERGVGYLPLAIGEIHILRPIPQQAWAYARWSDAAGVSRKMHITLLDSKGLTCVELREVAMQPLKVEGQLVSEPEVPTALEEDPAPVPAVVTPASVLASYPLTKGQEGIWFLCRLAPEAYAYNIPFAFKVGPETDPAKLRRAFQAIHDRHPALRTVFREVDDAPRQHVMPPSEVHFLEEDLAPLDGEALAAQLLERTRAPFDLEAGPLLRVFFFRRADQRPILLINIHHLVFDGVSYNTLIDELLAVYGSTVYGSEVEGHEHDLPSVEESFRSFEAWQRQMLSSTAGEELLKYWRKQLAHAPRQLELPVDLPRPTTRSFAGDTLDVELESHVVKPLRALARRSRTNLFSLCLQAFGLLLARQARQQEVLVATAVTGRPDRRWDGVVGYFVNLLPVRMTFLGNPRLSTSLEALQETVFELLEHADLPFPSLVEALEIIPEADRSPLCQASFIWQNLRANLGREYGPGREEHALSLEPIEGVHQVGEIELSLEVFDLEDRLCLAFKYDPALFLRERIHRLAEQYEVLLASFAEGLETGVLDLEWLSEAARRQLLVHSQGPRLEGATVSLQAAFADAATAFADSPALSFEDETVTYAALDRRTHRLAHRLRQLGVGPDVRVGIRMRRSIAMAEAVLAVLKAGGAWVPMDPAYPEERLRRMEEDADPVVVLTEATLSEIAARNETLRHETSRNDTPRAVAALEDVASAENLLFVIYTSGSTGRPKGVAMSRGTIANLIRWQIGLDSFRPRQRTVQLASLSFDVSVQELFETWCSGGEIVLVSETLRRDANALLRFLRDRRIQRMHQPFVGLQALAAAFEDQGFEEQSVVPGALREVYTAGEALQASRQLRSFFKALPDCSFHNHYGPTEAHVVTAFDLPRDPETWTALPPIGSPIARTRIDLLDSRLRRAPIGVAGELYIAGANLARGYLDRPGLTAERFVPDPSREGERLYRTGDLARWRTDGAIEYLGRCDHQVKVRGYRIEPGEIEALLSEQPDVRDAAVVVHEASSGDRRLVAFVVPAGTEPGRAETGNRNEGKELSDDTLAASLRGVLTSRLPSYMVPSAILFVSRFPSLPSGKLNRQALQERAAAEGAAARTGRLAPRTMAEELLCGIWAEGLKVPAASIGADSHFFELGGNSLTATRLCALIRRTFAVEVPLAELFAHPTVEALAGRLPAFQREGSQNQNAAPNLAAPAPAQRPDALPLSFAQERLWFLDRMEGPATTYSMPYAWRLEGDLDIAALSQALRILVDRHESLRTRFGGDDASSSARQIIEPPGAFTLRAVDLSGLNATQAETVAAALLDRDTATPFELDRGPLFRATLLRLAETLHVLSLNMHHIISDGWSLGVIRNELALLYRACRNDEDPTNVLQPLPIQYADYALWQRDWLQGEALEQQLAYWTRQLQGSPQSLDLPTRGPRPAVQTFHGQYLRFHVDPELANALRQLALETHGTLFLVLEAAFVELVGRFSGARELNIGTPVANRRYVELESLIGFFVNPLILRHSLDSESTVLTRIAQARETALDAFAHQDLPFEKLVEALNPVRDTSRSAFFQVMFALQSESLDELELTDIDSSPWGLDYSLANIAKYELTLNLAETGNLAESGDGLSGDLIYNTDLFDPDLIERMTECYVELLRGFAASSPETKAHHLSLLSQAQRSQVLEDFNRPGASLGASVFVPRLIRDQTQRTPDALAVRWGPETLTYRELDRRSDWVAHHLMDQGVRPGERVALDMGRSLELVAAQLGILKAGAVFVPLDPEAPAERIRYIERDADCRLRLTRQGLGAIWRSSLGAPEAASRLETLPFNAPAYVIYTSGSTGNPKGTVISHHSLADLVAWYLRDYGLGAGDRMAMLASPAFDASILEVWPSLASGASLEVIDKELLDPELLTEHFNQQRITHVFLTTPLMELMMRTGCLERLRTLRYLLAGGDRLASRPENSL
ncbi:MAG: amino acid adenylation domain-containing protein, partial [Acidobacteriota bacterium]